MNNIPEFSVTEISNLTKNILEENFSLIRVKGEISSVKNFKGHLYFSIKDDTNILNAVCWASKVSLLESKASRLPNLNFGANYGNNWGRSIDPTTNSFIAQQIKTSGLSGNSSLNLFTGGQIHFSIKQSQLNLFAAKYDLESTKDNVAMNIANFYLNVIFNQELLENALLQLKSTQQQLNRTQRLVAVGSLPRTSELALVS